MDRLLLLLPTTTYRTEAFIDAARTLGVDEILGAVGARGQEQQQPGPTHGPALVPAA